MIRNSDFKPAWGIINAHAQTVYSALVRPEKAAIENYERLELPDGDFIDLAWSTNGLDKNTPLVILLHGLGGSVDSVYVSGLLRSFNQMGYRGVLMLFRGAGREPNRLPRAYHSGETGDLSYLLEFLHQREPNTRKAVVGVSLGGNVLLKWLGEMGAQSFIEAAVAVSVPFKLDSVAERINQGFSRIYQSHLLSRLQSLFLEKLEIVNTQLPLSKQELFSLKTFRDFDDRITAPLHGFKNAESYYQQSSSRQYLCGIATPTLIIHAIDDPFMIPEVIPGRRELSENITLELSERGGHVGFITGTYPMNHSRWLEKRIPKYLKNYLK